MDTMKYVTIEEQDLLEKLAKRLGIKDFTISTSLSCHQPVSEYYDILKKLDNNKVQD